LCFQWEPSLLMKTQTKTNILIAAFTLLVLAMGTTATYIGILEKDPVKTWIFPVIGMVVAVVTALYWLREAYYWYANKKHNELKATGVLDFIDSVTLMDDMRKIIRENDDPDTIILHFLRLAQEQGYEKEVHGVVCGEEVVGYAEGVQLVVTVTKPETARAFRKLSRDARKYITVVEVK